MKDNKSTSEINDKLLSRRGALKAIGVAGVASTAGCLGTLGGKSEFQRQLEEAKSGGDRFVDGPQAAMDAGYTIRGPLGAGTGYTLTHPERRDGYTSVDDIELTEPSFLLYNRDKQLGAVGYHGRVGNLPRSPGLFADETAEASESWGDHGKGSHFYAGPDDATSDLSIDELMDPEHWAAFHPQRPSVSAGDEATAKFGPQKKRATRVIDHIVHHPDILSLTVWTHVEHPENVFAGSNSKFTR